MSNRFPTTPTLQNIAKYRGHSKMVILNLIFPVETCPADVSSSAFAPGIATGCCAFGVFAIGLASAGPKGRQRDQLIKMMMSSISGFEGWRRTYFLTIANDWDKFWFSVWYRHQLIREIHSTVLFPFPVQLSMFAIIASAAAELASEHAGLSCLDIGP